MGRSRTSDNNGGDPFGDGISPDRTVVDNSQNFVFFPTQFPGYDAEAEGDYNIRLSAFDATRLLAVTEIVVNVTDDFMPVS